MTGKRVLIVAYYFPPLGGIGSIRTRRFASLLSDHGWEATVLAPSNGAYHRDESLSFPAEQVVRARSLELSRLGKRVAQAGGDDTTAATVRGLRRRLRDGARRHVYRPDAQIGWYPGAILAGRRALGRERFDAVLSTSFPITAHLVGSALARRARIPWVAEFRDPWSDVIADQRARARAARLEQRLLRDAAAVVTVSPTWAELFRWKGASAVHVITNGFDEASPHEPSDRFVLGHLGTIYETAQDLDSVWRAVAEARGAGEELVDELRFIGELPPSVRARLEALGLGDLVRETGFLPFDAARSALSSTSALIAAGPPDLDPVRRGWIPAKLFEYLATPIPVVYVGHRENDAARLLAGLPDCHVIQPGDTAAVRAALRAARQPAGGRDASAYAAGALARQLAAVLDGVC